jgi:hypothetical protein
MREIVFVPQTNSFRTYTEHLIQVFLIEEFIVSHKTSILIIESEKRGIDVVWKEQERERIRRECANE